MSVIEVLLASVEKIEKQKCVLLEVLFPPAEILVLVTCHTLMSVKIIVCFSFCRLDIQLQLLQKKNPASLQRK